MSKIWMILFCVFSTNTYSQNIVLSGKVYSFNLKETGKIYYAPEGEKFNPAHFILYNKNRGYTFKMNISNIKKNKINTLVFSVDTLQKTNDEYACVQRIHLGEIAHSSEFSKLKTIQLKTDLLLDLHCSSGSYYDAKMENKERFTGTYLLTTGDTVRTIKLNNVFFQYSSSFSKMTKEYMTEEAGGWSFNEEKKKLTFMIQRQTNERYGLVLSKYYEFEFVVNETANGMEFISKAGVLKKL